MSTPAWQLAPAIEEEPKASAQQPPAMDDVQGAPAPVQTPENNVPAWMQAPLADVAESRVESPPDGPLARAVKLIAATSPKHATIVGMGETAAQVVTGIPAAAAGTVAGAVDAVREGDINKFPETFKNVAEEHTYQPRTKMGKKLSGAVAYPFEKAEELGGKAGNAVLDATDRPGLATVTHVATAGVPYAVGYALGMRGRRAGDEPPRAAEAPRVEPEWSKAEQVKPEEAALQNKPAENPVGFEGEATAEVIKPRAEPPAEIPRIETPTDAAAHEAATSPLNSLPEPTEAMKRAGNYAKGHLNLNGLDISVENPKGSTRSGVGPDGKPWKVTMQSHYGYIKRTLAKDGDNVDVFLGPKAENPNLPVFVIDQVKPKTRAFDEVKTLIGFENEPAARAGYLANYKQGWQGLGNITRTTLDDFKTWLEEGNTKKPFAPQAQPKPAAPKPATSITTAQTGQPFEAKLMRGQGRNDSPYSEFAPQEAILGSGRYTTSDRAFAEHFGPNITEHNVKLQNPLVIKSDKQWLELTKRAGWKFPNPVGGDVAKATTDIAKMRTILEGEGWDGVVVRLSEAYKKGLSDDSKLIDRVFGGDQVIEFNLAKPTPGEGTTARLAPAGTRVTTPQPQETVTDAVTGKRSAGAMEAEAITPQSRLGDALDATMEPLKKAGKEIVDVTGGKSISYLDDLAKASPTAKKLRNTMEYTEFSKEPIDPSFYERTSLKTGEYVSRLENTLDTLRGSFRRKLPEDINAKLAAALRGEKGTGISGETVLRLRTVLNDVRRYAKAQGLEVGFLPNYFPRVYKQRVLESDAGRADFIKVLQKHGIEATEADTIAARIVNHDGILIMERGPASERINPMKPQESKPFELGRMLKQKARTDKSLETARTLARIPDKELAPFLEDAVPAVLTRYITHAVRRAEYARAFGAGEGKLNRMVRDIITEAAQAGRPVRHAEIQRIYDLADAMQHKYRPIMSSTGHAANNFLISYQYLRTLPLATLSSLSEPFIVVSRGRPSVIPQAIARSLSHAVRETLRSVYRKFPKAEATKALEDVGLGLDAALSERLTASFGGEITKFTTTFFKLNFLHQFTRFNRVLGNETGKLMVTRHLKDLKRGVPERRASQLRRELAELGVDTDKGLSWIERGAKQNDPFYETVKAAGLRFTNEVVMNPRPTNRPMWHSNPHFHLLAQLKGFQTVFGNTVLPRWYNMIVKRGAYEGTKNAAKIATAGVLMTYTAMLANDLREVIKHGPGGNPKFKDEDPTKTVYRAMERAGFLGVFQFASDAMYAHRFGSPALAQLLGPQASQVNELIEGAGQAIDGKQRPLARAVVNSIPGANVIPSVRKDMVDAMAGEPERRGRRK